MEPKQSPKEEELLREFANWLPVLVLGFVALIYMAFAWQVDRARTSGEQLFTSRQNTQANRNSDR